MATSAATIAPKTNCSSTSGATTSKRLSGREGTHAATVDAAAQFIAGGLFGLLVWWLSASPRLSVDEVNRLFRGLAIPALRAIVK